MRIPGHSGSDTLLNSHALSLCVPHTAAHAASGAYECSQIANFHFGCQRTPGKYLDSNLRRLRKLPFEARHR